MPLATLLGAALMLSPAGAAPAVASSIEWIAPPECPDRQALLGGIARRQGTLEPAAIAVSARIDELDAGGYRMELEIEIAGHREARVLEARSCTALVDAAALRIAITVDAATPTADASTEEAGAETPSGEVEPPTMESPPPIAPLVPPPEARESQAEPQEPEAASDESDELDELDEPTEQPAIAARGPGGFIRLHGLGEIGALPAASGGLGLAGGLLWPRVRVEFHASVLAPQSVTRSQAELRAWLAAGAIHGCGRLVRGRLEVPLCGGFEFGAMPGSARGPGVDGAALGGWIAGVATIAVRWSLAPRVALFGALHGVAAARRTSFVLRDPGPEVVLYDPGLLSARIALGIELRLGRPSRARVAAP